MAAAEKSGSETTWSSSKSMATSVRRSLKSSDRNESKSSISAEYPSAPSLATGGAVPAAAAAGLGRATTWLQTARTRFIAVTWRLVSAEGHCAGRRMRRGVAVRCAAAGASPAAAPPASCHEMTSASRATFPLENTGGIFYIEFILLCPWRPRPAAADWQGPSQCNSQVGGLTYMPAADDGGPPTRYCTAC
jgi:hypothetical protein